VLEKELWGISDPEVVRTIEDTCARQASRYRARYVIGAALASGVVGAALGVALWASFGGVSRLFQVVLVWIACTVAACWVSRQGARHSARRALPQVLASMGRCTRCGYDLHGQALCTECGNEMARRD
jgi:hypothetical protein